MFKNSKCEVCGRWFYDEDGEIICDECFKLMVADDDDRTT